MDIQGPGKDVCVSVLCVGVSHLNSTGVINSIDIFLTLKRPRDKYTRDVAVLSCSLG